VQLFVLILHAKRVRRRWRDGGELKRDDLKLTEADPITTQFCLRLFAEIPSLSMPSRNKTDSRFATVSGLVGFQAIPSLAIITEQRNVFGNLRLLDEDSETSERR
jgi:hypothetical protein